LLRPYPQFGNISMFQVSEGINRYNAGIVEVSKRLSHGWGGRFSYTYSQMKDNQIGESNFYTNNGVGGPMNHYNYDATMPACSAGQELMTRCFAPQVDYTYSVLDVPHRFILAPIVQLPSPAKSGLANWLGAGWTAAAIFNFQS